MDGAGSEGQVAGVLARRVRSATESATSTTLTPIMIQAMRWTPLSVTPVRPSFMGDGDCELVQEMKPLITENFTLRDVAYRTDCFAHEITLNGFSVTGQALKAVSPSANGVKGPSG